MTRPKPAVRAHTLPLQGGVNQLIRALLRAPLIGRLVGKRLLTMYVVGRKSGRLYHIPVAYTRQDGALLIGSQFPWVRNLRTGEPIEILLLGKLQVADVELLSDETRVVEHFATMARDNQGFAKFNQIELDEHGEPSSDDLHLAWAAGARGARLIPR